MAGILIVDQIQNSANTLLINAGGLAGNTVSNTQINTASYNWNLNGNLGVNNTSPSYSIDVAGTTRSQVQSGSTNNTAPIALIASNKTTAAYATGQGASLQFEYVNSGGGYSGGLISSYGGSDPFTADLRFYPRNYGFTEAMRIDSSGNIGIGMVPGSYGKFSIYNNAGSLQHQTFNISRPSSGTPALFLGTNGATNDAAVVSNNSSLTFGYDTSGTYYPTMYLNTSGNLTLGTTNASQSAGAGAKMSPNGYFYAVGTGYDTFSHYSTQSNSYKFYVSTGGLISAVTTTIGGISDIRYKENIVDIEHGLESIMALRPRKFDWKPGKGKDIKNDRGFIAQEFETVFPDLIDEWRDPAPEGEEPYKSVRAELIPVLVKAIQEQQAIITQQAADIAALKAKVGI
jgi:hypothetical protein